MSRDNELELYMTLLWKQPLLSEIEHNLMYCFSLFIRSLLHFPYFHQQQILENIDIFKMLKKSSVVTLITALWRLKIFKRDLRITESETKHFHLSDINKKLHSKTIPNLLVLQTQ